MIIAFIFFIGVTVLSSASAQNSFAWNAAVVPPIPTLFAEGIVSTALNERDFALSPDGTEMFYTVSIPKSVFQTIVHCQKQKDGSWSRPMVATFAGHYSDLEPAFSADGSTLYFVSNRPLAGTEKKDFDIWKVQKQEGVWGQPENIGAPVNTKADEFYPSVAQNGNLYFTAAYAKGPGREDIYVAHYRNARYQQPVALDSGVNSSYYEFNAFIAPDESYILFTSYGREDDRGGGDLYMSKRDEVGKWLPATNLKGINSMQLDYCPFVSPDGKILFFTSERHELPVSFETHPVTLHHIKDISTRVLNGTGNIYWLEFEKAVLTEKR